MTVERALKTIDSIEELQGYTDELRRQRDMGAVKVRKEEWQMIAEKMIRLKRRKQGIFD